MATSQAFPIPMRGAVKPSQMMPADAFQVTAVHEDFTSASLSIPLLTQRDCPAAASYRVLAHRLERQGAPQVVVVTGTRPGDGTTTVALNLAAALAERDDRPVLLVEANRQRPALLAGFGISISDGFDDQLLRATDLAPMTWSTVGLCNNRLEMLAVDRGHEHGDPVPPFVYRRLLGQARERYAHVIVDCSSVTCGGEVSVLEDFADGTVLVARGMYTRARDLRRAVEQLAPSNLLGIVVCGGEV
jgi:Mrp family chromosome partitioning ATPase